MVRNVNAPALDIRYRYLRLAAAEAAGFASRSEAKCLNEGDRMVDLPGTSVLCPGSGLPTDIVEDMTSHLRTYMCVICGATMTDLPLASAHPARLG